MVAQSTDWHTNRERRGRKMRGFRGSSFSPNVARKLLVGSCLAGSAVFSQAVSAQDEVGPSETHGLGEIVVTARYIAEDVQDTPIAITTQTSDQLKAANVNEVSNLGAVVPNLQTVPGDSQSAGTPLIRMRGVIQGDTSSLAVPPAVAIYTDGIYHASTAGSELDFTDIDHIEVSRGPQSTLSGNASIGGSIKIFTKDPVGDGSGYVSLTGGSRKKIGASGAIDIGLSPTLSFRASGSMERQDGFVHRLDFACQMAKQGTPERAGSLPYFQPDSSRKDCVLGTMGGGVRSVGQVKLRWQPNEDIDLILTARHREDNLEDTPEIAPEFYDNPLDNPNALIKANNYAVYNKFGIILSNDFAPPVEYGGYANYATNCRPAIDKSVEGFSSDFPDGLCYPWGKTAHHTLYSGQLNAKISDNVGMTAIVGHTNYANEFVQNGDQSPLGYAISNFHNTADQWSGELRFAGSSLDDKLKWVLGGYFLRFEGQQNNFISFFTIYQLSRVFGKMESQSVFTHLDYNLTDNWRVSGGARYTDAKLAVTIDNPQAVTVADPVESIQHRWDWLIATDYRVTDDILLYASAASGSRPAGLTTILNTPRQLAPTAAEELISYEAGIKADLLDRRLRVNLASFYTDYKSVATSVRGFECFGEPGPRATWYPTEADCAQYAPDTSAIFYNMNVGIPAHVKGFEWEITAIPIDGLRIDWSGGFNRFVSGIKTPGVPGYITPGNHRQPEWNMHANVSYDIVTPVGTFTPRIDWSWQSQQDFNGAPQLEAPREIFIIDPYSIFNAQISYESPDRSWSATLSVANVGDKFYHYQTLESPLGPQTRLAPPREFSLTLRKNF